MSMRRRPRGFSLIEVIAALLLLAIAFTALMKVAGGAIDLTHRATERSEAAMWARSLLDSAFVIEPPQAGTRTGRFDKRYRWQLQVTPWTPPGKPSPNPPLQLYQLDLDVHWSEGGHEQDARFSTLRAGLPIGAGTAAGAAGGGR